MIEFGLSLEFDIIEWKKSLVIIQCGLRDSKAPLGFFKPWGTEIDLEYRGLAYTGSSSSVILTSLITLRLLLFPSPVWLADPLPPGGNWPSTCCTISSMATGKVKEYRELMNRKNRSIMTQWSRIYCKMCSTNAFT